MIAWNCVLFFKQKTAYEMRISDWSSDVCSSDLAVVQRGGIDEGLDCRSRLPLGLRRPVEGAKARIEAALHGVDAAVMRNLNDHSDGDPRNIAENQAISLRLDGDQVARPPRIESRAASLGIRHGCSPLGQCACCTDGKAHGGAG